MNIDLSDPTLYESGNPVPIWSQLRTEHPVYRNERAAGGYFWAIMTHPLCVEVLTDPRTFSSTRGMRLDTNPRVLDATAGKMLNVTDPPRHGKMRQVVNSAFTPSMVRRLEVNMRATVAKSIDRALASGGACEFTRMAQELPVSVICDMLGVPPEDRNFMVERTRLAWSSTALDEAEEAKKIRAHTEIFCYFEELAAERRRAPREDLMSALVGGRIDGVPLTDQEVFYNCDALISGGNETTRHSTVGGLLAFIENPDQWQELRSHPELMPSAIQEIVRYTSPVMHALRTATADVTLNGQSIRAGDSVVAWLPSANRDETVFVEPDRFQIGRSPNRHLGFIQGNHYCIGATLATLELTVMFDELVRRIERVELAGEVRRARSNLLWGFDALPVRFIPRSNAS